MYSIYTLCRVRIEALLEIMYGELTRNCVLVCVRVCVCVCVCVCVHMCGVIK